MKPPGFGMTHVLNPRCRADTRHRALADYRAAPLAPRPALSQAWLTRNPKAGSISSLLKPVKLPPTPLAFPIPLSYFTKDVTTDTIAR